MIKCGRCKKSLTLKELTHHTTKVNNNKAEFWCNDCYLTYSVTCECCYELFDFNLVSNVGGEKICNGCILKCDKCGWQGSHGDVEWPDDLGQAKCPSCYEKEYSYCKECCIEYNNVNINNSPICPECNTRFHRPERME